jgi:hypothetical protein
VDIPDTISRAAMSPTGAIVIVAVVPWLVLLLIWRGSEKLGVVGIGTTIKMDLDYVIRLVEHAIGKPPSHELERAKRTSAAPPKPKP